MPSSETADAPRGLSPAGPDVGAVVHAHPPIATGFAVAGVPLNRAVLAEVVTTLGSIPIAEYAHAVHRGAAGGRAASTSRRTTACCWPTTARSPCGADVMRAYYKMETIEHFAKISLVARLLGGENLISREEVERLQGLRGTLRHQGAGADLCRSVRPGRSDPARIQRSVRCWKRQQAAGERLVPDGAMPTLRNGKQDGEIRLTYGELTALIADAVKTSLTERLNRRQNG